MAPKPRWQEDRLWGHYTVGPLELECGGPAFPEMTEHRVTVERTVDWEEAGNSLGGSTEQTPEK